MELVNQDTTHEVRVYPSIQGLALLRNYLEAGETRVIAMPPGELTFRTEQVPDAPGWSHGERRRIHDDDPGGGGQDEPGSPSGAPLIR